MINKEIDKALHNCGYRYLGSKDGKYIYGKSLGYGILRADVRNNTKLSVELIVKGDKENLLWTHKSRSISTSSDDDKYLICVQAIKDNEAEIFSKTPVASSVNRLVRYDFEENRSLEAVLGF